MRTALRWTILVALVAVTTVLVGRATGPRVAAEAAGACGGVGGTVRVADLTVPQRGGGSLAARAYAPDAERQTAPCPLVVLLPGGGAGIDSVEWSAQRLAADGYVAVVVKPERGGSTDSYYLAAVSAMDLFSSPDAPFRSAIATEAMGIAGWSLGARSLTRVQAEDVRVKALVAWDNLAVRPQGDEGSPACQFMPGATYPPRVPAMGQASDSCGDGRSADAKKTAYEAWRAAGVPAMQLVFAGSTHFWWGSQGEAQGRHDLLYSYTLAWFDRWLKGDPAATARLLARQVDSRPLGMVLSTDFTSAVYLDGIDCPDLRQGCPASDTPGSEPATATAAVPTPIRGTAPPPTASTAVICYLPAALRSAITGP